MPVILCRLVWIISAAATVAMVGLFAHSQVPIQPPGSMMSYEAGDKSFTMQCPTNWRRTGAGGAGGTMVEVDWDPGPDIHFMISSDLAGSLMGDIARATNVQSDSLSEMAGQAGEGGAQEQRHKSPVETLHDAQGESLSRQKADYQEGITTKAKLGSQEAVITDFTFKRHGLFGSREITGKRATMLSHDRRYSIVYFYPKVREAEIEPVFKSMLMSVKQGTPGG